jgi:nucleoside-diphosphate-sugar epimerase
MSGKGEKNGMKSTSASSLLVLGAGGAIGSATVAQAVQAGCQVHATVRPGGNRSRLPLLQGSQIHEADIADTQSLRTVIVNAQPSVLVMAAAPPAHPGPTKVEREMHLQHILAMQFALFDALEQCGCQAAVVLIGSSTVYGAGMVRDPLGPMRPQNVRGVAKAAEWILAQQLAAEQNRLLLELRVFCAYGRWMRRERLLTKALQAALTGEKIRLTATPLPRDWIHHDDIGRAVMSAVQAIGHGSTSQVINLCSGTVVDCHDVIRRLEALCGRSLVDSSPFPGGDKMGEVLAGVRSLERDLPGWVIRVDLDSGLRDLWHWALSEEGRHYLLDEGKNG